MRGWIPVVCPTPSRGPSLLEQGISKGGYGISWFQFNPPETQQLDDLLPKQTFCPKVSGLQPKGHSLGKGKALPAFPSNAGPFLPGKGTPWKGKGIGHADGKGESPKRASHADVTSQKKKKQTKESEEACSWSMGSTSSHGALSGDES